jgi:ubiquinone/menaquinone biosynthesis C-methylase UbiE
VNGLFYDVTTSVLEWSVLSRLRRALISPLRGSVVEVGAGTGANFTYYSYGVRVLAIEPDESMARRARIKARRARANIELHDGDDAFLDTMPSASADAVVMALVLCTVEDPHATLERARRVLKPRGNLVVIEHVRSPGRTGVLQDVIAPMWKRVAGGCRVNRRTEAAIAASGFDIRSLRTHRLPKLSPIRDIVYGVAVAC